MKLINPTIAILIIVASVACSKEEPQPETPKTAAPDITRTQTGRINDAQKALNDAKQVNQAIQDSAAQQQETIEKTQQ